MESKSHLRKLANDPLFKYASPYEKTIPDELLTPVGLSVLQLKLNETKFLDDIYTPVRCKLIKNNSFVLRYVYPEYKFNCELSPDGEIPNSKARIPRNIASRFYRGDFIS